VRFICAYFELSIEFVLKFVSETFNNSASRSKYRLSGRLSDSVLFPSWLYRVTDKRDLTFTALYTFQRSRKVEVHREKMETVLFLSETMNALYFRISWQPNVETWQSAIIEWRLIKSRIYSFSISRTTRTIYMLHWEILGTHMYIFFYSWQRRAQSIICFLFN